MTRFFFSRSKAPNKRLRMTSDVSPLTATPLYNPHTYGQQRPGYQGMQCTPHPSICILNASTNGALRDCSSWMSLPCFQVKGCLPCSHVYNQNVFPCTTFGWKNCSSSKQNAMCLSCVLYSRTVHFLVAENSVNFI